MNVNNINVRPLSAVSFDNETSSKKASNVDTFEMVRGGTIFKSHKGSAKDGKCSSSSCKDEPAQAQTQNQAQSAKEANVKDEAPAQAQGQSQAQGAKEAQAQGKF